MTYPDWEGTAQLGQRMTGKVVNEIIGLDRDEWFIMGMDIGGGETRHNLRIIAVHRGFTPEGGDVFPKVAAANSREVPATELLVQDMDPCEVLRVITHVLELRLELSGLRDLPIRIMSQSDVPEQFMQP